MEESKSPRLRQFLEYEIFNIAPGKEYSVRMRPTDVEKQVGEWSEWFHFTSVTELAPVLVESPALVVRVGEFKNVDMKCRIESLPPPTYVWFKDGVELNPDDNIIFTDATLTLKNVKRGNKDGGGEGKYKCKGSNVKGTVESKEAQLIVECKFFYIV